MRRKVLILIALLTIVLGAVAVAGVYWALGHRGFRALEAANQAYAKGDWGEARRQYSWYLARQRDDEEILLRYAEVCEKVLAERQDMLRGAAQAYLRISTLRETDRDAALKAAEFCERHSLWIDLDYCTSIFLKRYPEDATLKYWKALAMHRLGDTNGAVERYQELAALPDCRPEVYGALAALLVQQGFGESADRALNEAIERDPENAALLIQRARFNLDRTQLEAAERDVQAALTQDPTLVDAQLVAAQIKLARQDWEGAAAGAAATLSAKPTEEGYVLLSRANFQRGRTEETVDVIKAAEPAFLADHPTLYMILADLQLELERFDEAKITIDAYRRAYPDDLAAFDYLEARELMKRDKFEEAAEALKLAVEKAPNSQHTRLLLIHAYLQSNRKDQARIALITHLQAFPYDEQAKAMWETYFVTPSTEQATARAEELLQDGSANSRALITAASQLRQSVGGAVSVPAAADLVARLLERALEKEPTAPEPFRDLLAWHLSRNEIDRAQELLARAQASGMKPQILGFASAAIALSQKDQSQALAILNSDLDRTDVSRAEVSEWARLFASQQHLDISLEILQKFASGVKDESERLGFEVDAIGYALLAGDLDRALSLVRELEPRVGGEPGILERLGEEKLRIAEACLQRRSPEDIQTAEAIVSEVRQAGEANPKAKLLEARLLTLRVPPELDKAEELCASLREAEGVDPQVYLLSADIARGRGLPERALEFSVKAATLSPSEFPVQLSLVQAQLQSGLYGQAIAELEQLLPTQQRNPLVLDLLARAYAGAGRAEDAQRYLAQLESETAAMPQSAKAVASLRTWLALCRKDWPVAEKLAKEQYEADSTDYGAMRFLVDALDGQGRRGEAEAIIKSAAETAKTPQLWTDLGRWYLGAKDPESRSKASTAFTSALSASPNFPPALKGQATVARFDKNLMTAIRLYDRYLKIVPDDADVLLQKGTLLLAANDFEGAVRDLNRAAELREGASAQIDVELAYAYLGLHDMEKARQHRDAAKQKVTGGEVLADPALLEQLDSRLAGATS